MLTQGGSQATSTTLLLYGYKDVLGRDPHERIIEIDESAMHLLDVARDVERRYLTRWEVGTFVPIEDIHGVEWEVASAPCGSPCHCAAIIRKPKGAES